MRRATDSAATSPCAVAASPNCRTILGQHHRGAGQRRGRVRRERSVQVHRPDERLQLPVNLRMQALRCAEREFAGTRNMLVDRTPVTIALRRTGTEGRATPHQSGAVIGLPWNAAWLEPSCRHVAAAGRILRHQRRRLRPLHHEPGRLPRFPRESALGHLLHASRAVHRAAGSGLTGAGSRRRSSA